MSITAYSRKTGSKEYHNYSTTTGVFNTVIYQQAKLMFNIVDTPVEGQSTSSCWLPVEPPPQKLEGQFECPLLSRGEAQSQLERASPPAVQMMVVLKTWGTCMNRTDCES